MKYVVSACLAGHACRYDGKASPCPEVMELVRRGEALPLCPESLSGLPAPRPPSEWQGERAVDKNGTDVTEALLLGASLALEKALATGAGAAILKARSPSCGCNVIYDGTFSGRRVPGQGAWARRLAEAGFALYDEENLPPL